MANENLAIDENNKSTAGAVTDDAAEEIRMLRIDDATKGLKVMLVGGAGAGTVTSVSVTTANGVSGSVATATSTPAITLTLGAITPSAVQISGLTASEIVLTDASKNLVSAAVATYPSLTELTYVKGVTSAIQTQLNTKEVTLTFGDGLTRTANDVDVDAAQPGITTATALPWTGLKVGTDGEIPTFDSSGNPSFVAAGNSGQVLTSNGAGAAPTFQTIAGSSTPSFLFATVFESTSRLGQTIVGGGGVTLNSSGLYLKTGAAGGGAFGARYSFGVSQTGIEDGSPSYSVGVYTDNSIATIGSSFFGMGTVTIAGTGHTYTTKHIGFKILVAAGVASVYATQGNGTTETASSALTTITANDTIYLTLKVNGTASVDYYWQKNNGALSSATNLTTNIPADADSLLQTSVSNDSNAEDLQLICISQSYQR